MMSQRGDTIVEVLMATVVLSIVLAGAFTLSNKAIQTGQSSLERTEAVNVIRDYAEALRFIHTTEVDGYNDVWSKLISLNGPKPNYSGDAYCAPTESSQPLYLNFSELDDSPDANVMIDDFSIETNESGQLKYAEATDGRDDLFAVWFEVYDTSQGVVDIHIRACWDTLGGHTADRVGSVLRLPAARDI